MPSPRTVSALAVVGGALFAVTACTPTLTVTTAKIDPTPQVELVANPIQASEVDPNAPVLVAATQGVLTEISVTGPEGEVPGTLSDDRTEWIATSGPLDYAATYTVNAVGSDSRGRTDVLTHSFTTVEPEKFFTATATPAAGEVVGVREATEEELSHGHVHAGGCGSECGCEGDCSTGEGCGSGCGCE